MSVIGEAGFVLYQKELVFLAALTGADELYGIDDNSFQMDENEIAEEWEKAREQLETKKYIEVDFDNSITVDNDLFELIVACCNPKVFIRNVRIEEDSIHMRNIYITENIAVELDQDRLSKNKWILTPLVSIEKVAANLVECFVTEKTYEGDGTSIDINISEFEKINEFLQKEEISEAVDLLKNLDCNEEDSEDFIGSLRDKSFCSSLLIMLIDYDGMSDVISYSYYGGLKHLWRVDVSNLGREDGQDKVSLCKVGSGTALKEIEKMILSLKNLYSSARKGDEQHG